MKLFHIISFCSLFLTAAPSHAMMGALKPTGQNDREMADYAWEKAIEALELRKAKALFAQECATHVAQEHEAAVEAAVRAEARKHCCQRVADKYFPLPSDKQN